MHNNYAKFNQHYFILLSGKSALCVEAWDSDTAQCNDDGLIDRFKVVLPNTSINSWQYKMRIVEGEYKIGNFTVIYYNLTIDETSSSSTDNPTSCISTHGKQCKLYMSK